MKEICSKSKNISTRLEDIRTRKKKSISKPSKSYDRHNYLVPSAQDPKKKPSKTKTPISGHPKQNKEFVRRDVVDREVFPSSQFSGTQNSIKKKKKTSDKNYNATTKLVFLVNYMLRVCLCEYFFWGVQKNHTTSLLGIDCNGMTIDENVFLYKFSSQGL